MMVQATSVEAFRQITQSGRLSRLNRQVLDFFVDHMGSNFTNRETARRTGILISTLTPRVLELRNLHYLRLAVKRRCSVTGFRAMAWELDTTAILQRDMETYLK